MKITKLLIVVFTVCVGFLVQAPAEDIDINTLLEKASKDPILEKQCTVSNVPLFRGSTDCEAQDYDLYDNYLKHLKKQEKYHLKQKN